jgi:nicotinamide-nucleotide amidase
MTARAGVVVTGTEVLSGRVIDRNGPWLSERLTELGVDHAHTAVVGDRPEDMRAALDFFAAEGIDLVVTSGGLGPTEDDLTAEVVAKFAGRELVLDEALEARIAKILERLSKRYPRLDMDAVRAGNRKQALVPVGATVLEPVGTAPGLVVPPANGSGPTVVVLPGPPGELREMWSAAVETEALHDAIRARTQYRVEMLRLFGIPESEIAETLRAARSSGIEIDELEITTCLRRGEIEVVTRFEPVQADVYARLVELVRERHPKHLFSEDGSTVDKQVADLLREQKRTIATAESCTGGLMASRLTEFPGSSAYALGGLVTYANEAKVAVAGVDPEVITTKGAVSEEVADQLADGAADRMGADVGIGITGIAGPEGGTPEKPVGTVCFSVALSSEGRRLTRRIVLPGSRYDVRDRSTTVAMHLVRRLLLGESDPA